MEEYYCNLCGAKVSKKGIMYIWKKHVMAIPSRFIKPFEIYVICPACNKARKEELKRRKKK